MTGRRIRLRRALGVSGILLLAVAGPMVGAALAAPQAVVVAEDDGGGGEAPAPSEPDPAPSAEPAPSEPEPAPETQAPSEPEPEPEPETSQEPEEEPSVKPTKKPKGEAADDEPVDDAGQDPDAVDEDSDAVDEDPDAVDEDGLDGDGPDEDGLDEDGLGEDGLDDGLDEDGLGEDGLDEDGLDEDGLDEDGLDEEVVDDGLDEEVVEEETSGGAGLGLSIEAQGDGVSVTASGAGLLPGSRAELWVFSTPRLLATGTADAEGAVTISSYLPADLPEGSHTVLLKGTDADGQPVEFADGIEIGPNGELLAVTEGVDATGLVVPTIPDDPKAPQYPTVTALDQPDAVVSTTVAALALLSVTGVAAAMAGGARAARDAGSGVAGGGINEGLGSGADLLVAEGVNVDHNRGWRTRFSSLGDAWGDRSLLHRAPLTSFVDEASFTWMAAVGPKSPLLARMIGDGAPLRAMVGSLSLLLPIAAIVLGVWSAIVGGGIAEPPVLGILIALMVIGVIDGLAGALGAVAFSVTVIAMGGILDWSSVRTLLGVALLIAGPGLIASSFRDIRRAAPRSLSGWWERGADVVIVPLLGAYTTYNIANAMPPLGGSLFPVADASTQLAWIVAAMLVLKVVLEEIAARWFPERMATILAEPDWPGTLQQVLSSLIRLGLFLFVSAAFIGSPWQLWVGALIWIVPTLLYPFSSRWRNSPRLWQILPADMPSLGIGLLVYLILAAVLASVYGDTTEFALMAFFILLIPGFIQYSLGLLGREPQADDVRWYLRPSMTGVYRVGGVVVLVITCWLAYRSIF